MTWYDWEHALSPERQNAIQLPEGSRIVAVLDEDDLVSDRDDALATQQSIKAYVDSVAFPTFKSFSFTSRGITSGTYYIAGFYSAPGDDADLSDVGPTIVLGIANISYAAHALLVASGAGSASGGSGLVEIEVSGTSISDAGVRTTSDSEVIVADITSMSLDQYFETVKKWIGQVTYTLQTASGGTHTTFTAVFNYGYCKYEDFGNRDFVVTDFEVVGLGGANDASFNIRLLHHDSENWTYAATGFVPGGTVILNISSIHSTEDQLGNNIPFAFKRGALSNSVPGSAAEGVIVEIVAGANNSVESMDAHIGVSISV